MKDPETEAILFIDHCTSWQVFKKRANEFFTEISKLLKTVKLNLVLNENGAPKRGSFEIYISKNKSSKKVLLWSGLKKGPPRKDKFPSATVCVADANKALDL